MAEERKISFNQIMCGLGAANMMDFSLQRIASIMVQYKLQEIPVKDVVRCILDASRKSTEMTVEFYKHPEVAKLYGIPADLSEEDAAKSMGLLNKMMEAILDIITKEYK